MSPLRPPCNRPRRCLALAQHWFLTHPPLLLVAQSLVAQRTIFLRMQMILRELYLIQLTQLAV